MKKKPKPKLKKVKGFDLGGNWDDHIEKIRPHIADIDRKTMESVALAHTMVVTNETK